MREYEKVRESYHFSPRRCCVPNRHLPLTAKAPALVGRPGRHGMRQGERAILASARIGRELLGKSMQANHACAMLTAPCHHRMEACVEGNWIRKEGPFVGLKGRVWGDGERGGGEIRFDKLYRVILALQLGASGPM